MLRPLLLLSAAALVAGLDTFSSSKKIQLDSCPMWYFGALYKEVYVDFTDQFTTLCFDGPFNISAVGDCIINPSVSGTSVTFHSVDGVESSIDPIIKGFFSRIRSSMLCHVYFQMNFTGSVTKFYLTSYGTQTATLWKLNPKVSMTFHFYAAGRRFVTTSFSPGRLSTRGVDVSSCRYQGTLIRYGRRHYDTARCTTAYCSQTATMNIGTCPKTHTCHGNNMCVSDLICTVSGSTVISVSRRTTVVRDRCVYQLLKSSSQSDVEIQAEFQDRRRKDVSFVRSITLKMGSEHIHLEQGGRVVVDGSSVNLSSVPQTFYSVNLTRDQTGVTAELTLAGRRTVVYFDGATVHVQIKGAPGSTPRLMGLCGNVASSLSDIQLLGISEPSCQERHTEPQDSSINCTAVTEHCALLTHQSFQACSALISPQPYMTACRNTLCSYPGLDRLNCQFLEAFAKLCSLYDIPLGDWRTSTSCPSPQIFCQDRTCSDHEFCGEKTPGGDTRCFCRSVFASKYKNSLGDPATCSQDSGRVSVSLVGCLLEDRGIDYSTLHLNNDTCVGQVDQRNHTVAFSYDNSNTCGAEITTVDKQMIFTNTIRQQSVSPDVVTRKHQVNINFSCIYRLPEIHTASFRIRDSAVIQTVRSGSWNYTLTMKAYGDAGLTRAVDPDTELDLDQKVWVELEGEGLEGGLVAMVTDSCWATKDQPADSSVRHNLITDGCADPDDHTVALTGNGEGTSNSFSFNIFEFSGSDGDVYLHCKVKLCPKTSNTTSNSCKPSCSSSRRRRRSSMSSMSSMSESAGEAFISMVWTK